MPLNLVVCQYLWVSVPYIIDVQTGVKYGNLADNQVEKSGHPAAILGVRMPVCPQGHERVQLSENLDLTTMPIEL